MTLDFPRTLVRLVLSAPRSLAARGVTFPVLDTEHNIAGEPTWSGWVESPPSVVIAVSVARGIDSSDRDIKVAQDDIGMMVWSFDPDRLDDDPDGPADHASLYLCLQFADRRGITVSDGMNEMDKIVRGAGYPIEVTVTGKSQRARRTSSRPSDP